MKNQRRGMRHTTKTETVEQVFKVLKKIPDITMIAPGIIDPKNCSSCSKKFITIVHTPAGCELLISGQGSQKLSIHTHDSSLVAKIIKEHKKLRGFNISERERMPDQ